MIRMSSEALRVSGAYALPATELAGRLAGLAPYNSKKTAATATIGTKAPIHHIFFVFQTFADSSGDGGTGGTRAGMAGAGDSAISATGRSSSKVKVGAYCPSGIRIFAAWLEPSAA